MLSNDIACYIQFAVLNGVEGNTISVRTIETSEDNEGKVEEIQQLMFSKSGLHIYMSTESVVRSVYKILLH